MSEKINRAVPCLYAIAGIQILSLMYAIAACMVAAIYKAAPELRYR